VHTLNFHPEVAGQFLAAQNVLRPFQFAKCERPPSGGLFVWLDFFGPPVPQGMALERFRLM